MITWKYMPHFDLFSMLSGSFGTDIFFWSISSILLLARIHVLQCFTGSQVPAGVVVGLFMMQQLSFTSYMPLHTLQRRPEVARMPGFPLTQNWYACNVAHNLLDLFMIHKVAVEDVLLLLCVDPFFTRCPKAGVEGTEVQANVLGLGTWRVLLELQVPFNRV